MNTEMWTTKMRRILLAAAAAAGLLCGIPSATALVVSGYLSDPINAALVGSDGYQDLRAPLFGNDNEIARNVAIYQLTVSTPGSLSFTSSGFLMGGAEPYFTLFQGTGIAASFLDSNGLSDPFNIDFSLTRNLAAGSYMFTLGVWENMSFAENNPDADPALGDGFTALGDPNRLGSSYYELEISSSDGAVFDATPASGIVTPSQPVPEPATLPLIVAALLLSVKSMRVSRPRR